MPLAEQFDGGRERGVSPVVGAILMVAIVVLLAVVMGAVALTYQTELGGPQVETVMSFEQTSEGILVAPSRIGQSVDVRLNGYPLLSFDENAAGENALLPVAPGDRITVTDQRNQQSVLLRETVSEGDAGEFIAYYAFDDSVSTLTDSSANDNHGTAVNGPQAVTVGDRTGMRFDGTDDRVDVPQLETSDTEDVREFTVATTFRLQGDAGSINQLVEHSFSGSGNEWYLETDTAPGSGNYVVDFAVNYPSDIVTSAPLETGTVYTVVATYDGETYELFVDGTSVASGTYNSEVEMGELTIGRDHESSIQYFDGEIFELRLYYTALDDDDVQVLSEVMSAEVAER